jgi:hypothetical protein
MLRHEGEGVTALAPFIKKLPVAGELLIVTLERFLCLNETCVRRRNTPCTVLGDRLLPLDVA